MIRSQRTLSLAHRGTAGITALPRLFLITCVRAYQAILSPYLGGQCRFHPSCSNYAIKSLEKDGALAGTLKTIWRLARCHPFSKGGVDYP
jgi:uncharacterized protein